VKWTQDTPTEPGYYWHWFPNWVPLQNKPIMMNVRRHRDLQGVMSMRLPNGHVMYTDEAAFVPMFKDTWWMGPIEPPAPPQEQQLINGASAQVWKDAMVEQIMQRRGDRMNLLAPTKSEIAAILGREPRQDELELIGWAGDEQDA
jgi:hypothetical protein